MARDRRSRLAMVLSHRRESVRTGHNRFRLRRYGLAGVRACARRLVVVLQPRALARTHCRTGTDRRGARRNVAAEARLDVAPVAVCLRDPDPVARVCGVGSRNESVVESSATRDDGRDDTDRMLWLVTFQARRY